MTTANEFMASFNASHATKKIKRKSAKQQVTEARAELLAEIRSAMVDKKRCIPQEWERGFMAAVSALEAFK